MKKVFCLLLPFVFSGTVHTNSYCSCSCSPGCCESSVKQLSEKKEDSVSIKEIVKQEYGKVAEGKPNNVTGSLCCGTGGCCGGGSDLSQYLGYTAEELSAVPDANLGLGCGHPVSLGNINEGDTVLDLGSGAGIDCFLAAKKVGTTGNIIGVDMTEAMIQKARDNTQKYGFENVEFRLGEIENLPVASNSVDIVISNCVINLSEDKLKVFKEAHRVLKPGGKMYVSDVVLLAPLSTEQKNDSNLICACVGGAILKKEYIKKLEMAGFNIEIVGEDAEIGKTWFGNNDLQISSLKFIAYKKL